MKILQKGKLVLASSLILLSSSLYSANFDNKIIKNIVVNKADWDSSLQGIVTLELDSDGVTGCINKDQVAFTMSTPGSEAMLKIALNAAENKRAIQVYTSGCHQWGSGGQDAVPKAVQIRMYMPQGE